MIRTRFAPSPTGSLHLGGALSALANRRAATGCCSGSTTPTRRARCPGGVEAIVEDLAWLGIAWDEGPAAPEQRAERHREAAAGIAGARTTTRARSSSAAARSSAPTGRRPTSSRASSTTSTSGSRTSSAAATTGQRAVPALALRGARRDPPEFVHHGLLLGPEGHKLSKRENPETTIAALRAAGYPAEAVRAYLEELGEPRHDVHLDLRRLRRLSTDAIGALSDEELAGAGRRTRRARAGAARRA